MKTNQFVNDLFCLEVIYSLEDFGNFTMIKSCIQNENNKINFTNELNKSSFVRMHFWTEGKEKEIILKIKKLKKVYMFVKIFYDKYYLNLLLYRNDEVNPNDLLKRINNNKYMKGAIYMNLKIKEFPLINYFLQEIQVNDNFADKIFRLVNCSGSLQINQNTSKNIYDTQFIFNYYNKNKKAMRIILLHY